MRRYAKHYIVLSDLINIEHEPKKKKQGFIAKESSNSSFTKQEQKSGYKGAELDRPRMATAKIL